MKKLLILGASGLVGKALLEKCSDDFEVYGTYSTRGLPLSEEKQFQLVCSESEKLGEIISTVKPDAIVSSIRGDFEEQLKFHKELASHIQHTESALYYISTANVFDGDVTKHHNESDSPQASSPYGQFKIDCEYMLQEKLKDRAVIIRIPQIWGRRSPRMEAINKGIEENTIDVYTNLECNHLSDTLLAKQLHYIITHNLKGIFHLGATDMMPHDQFIKNIVARLTDEKIHYQYKTLDPATDTYYFGLASIRKELPEELRETNIQMIDDFV
ncbi:sugar nucleotide-binding protein [Bacillus sp. KH172YL63]|uniref:sugar nucleotide-binding protein n=1 Tax=Bacillus sp. KH172YL63 TaxID=2709784 RepID=UPI0015640F64|nr:sugar nucleotide-binding protein [Bacillus sp. KH172YL63]